MLNMCKEIPCQAISVIEILFDRNSNPPQNAKATSIYDSCHLIMPIRTLLSLKAFKVKYH